MIRFGIMRWSNVFSYGEDNFIDFSANPLTQLIGKNGHGKSSIPLILELILFNKNSKGIKTADLINRYAKIKKYSISIEFTKDEDSYFISTTRASTQTVKLEKNGKDISAHTATNTFKLLEDILGFTHKEFVQLVYQSSSNSLEFLTAADSARKKFLIDLLDLGLYTKYFEILKTVSKEISDSVKDLETKASVVTAWLDKNINKDLTIKELIDIPEQPEAEKIEVSEINTKLSTIVKTNKLISDNNKYKELRDSLDLDYANQMKPERDPAEYQNKIGELNSTIKQATTFINSVSKLHNNCPTCGTAIDNTKSIELAEQKKQEKIKAEQELKVVSEELRSIEKIISENRLKDGILTQFESYSNLIRDDLQRETLSKSELEDRVIALTKIISDKVYKVHSAIELNKTYTAHNSISQVILSQMTEMQADLAIYKVQLSTVTKRLSILQVLQKSFSTNGLVAYKIEGMIKDLEDTVNEYLGDLSDGRFQLSFVIDGEKLNVVITDNGVDIDISALSTGERGRVNAATLLAIRKLMQQLSDVKINVLILDETLENFDAEGKERFIDLLLKETHLNTFLVSHSFQHPLLEKLTIIKEDKISRIEHG
jgi:DNA repair exonuclease SbcCD ATPase subunit